MYQYVLGNIHVLKLFEYVLYPELPNLGINCIPLMKDLFD